MAACYGVAGSAGLVALSSAMAFATVACTFLALRGAGVPSPAAFGILAVVLSGVAPLFFSIRPQIFSGLLFTVVMLVLSRSERQCTRWLAALPPVFALWANLHGGWIVGAGALGIWVIASAIRGEIPRRVGLLVLVASGGATLVTPYGFELWRFLWNTVDIGRPDISEWQPLWSAPTLIVLWIASLIVLGYGCVRRPDRWPLLLGALGLGVLSLKVLRLEPFFALSAGILAAPGYAQWGPARFPLTRPPSRAEIWCVGSITTLSDSLNRTSIQ